MESNRRYKLVFRLHAVRRMFQRQISEYDLRNVLATGEVIESYPDDTPYPSRLILGWNDERPLHIAVADNEKEEETIVITVYEPDSKHWEEGFRKRK